MLRDRTTPGGPVPSGIAFRRSRPPSRPPTPECGPRRRPGITSNRGTQIGEQPKYGAISDRTLALAVAGTVTVGAHISTQETSSIQDAAAVLSEIHGQPDKDIPQDLWEKAQCVVVIPSLRKAAFVFGGEYGRGLSVAAGPIGRTAAAATDAELHAEIISYSRAQGLFAGIDLSGGILKPDQDGNRDLYGAPAWRARH
jgi:lipid-binding SYLF domain-containing protein